MHTTLGTEIFKNSLGDSGVQPGLRTTAKNAIK